MTKPLTDSELDHLLDFMGYGTLDADVWFLGMEETGGGEANIRARPKSRLVEDDAEAHKMLGVTHLHWGRRKIQRTWRGMRTIMLRLAGQVPTRKNIRTYQAQKLGRVGSHKPLTKPVPIPKQRSFESCLEVLHYARISRTDLHLPCRKWPTGLDIRLPIMVESS